jgi:hypothetical protein
LKQTIRKSEIQSQIINTKFTLHLRLPNKSLKNPMKKIANARLFWLFLATLYGMTLYGQTTTKAPFELWSGVRLKYGIKKFDFMLLHEYRLGGEGLRLVEKQLTEIGVEYEILKNLGIGSEYRFGRDLKNSGYFPIDRIDGYLTYKFDVRKFDFSSRVQYQKQWTERKNRTDVKETLRFRTGVDYRIKNWKLDPAFDAELFVDKTDTAWEVNKLRLTLGSKYEIFKNLDLGFAYRREFGILDTADKLNALLLNLTYKI